PSLSHWAHWAHWVEWARDLFPGEDLGRRGEALAARELRRRGYAILERRWRCRIGEIDIIARDGEVLAVVEVKARSRSDYGAPIDAVDRDKRRKLEKLARAYLQTRRLKNVSLRFDLVGVTFRAGEKPRVEVFPDALRF
ncbi:MAG: YraN family protein, partial [Vicinamibacteria bacterium]